MAVPLLVNGVNYSWSNVTFMAYAVPFVGITEINYEKKQKVDLNYGSGTLPVSEGEGNEETTGDITLYLDEWNKLIAAATGNNPIAIPRSDMQVVFGGSRISQKVDVLKAVRFMNDPVQVKQGDGKILVKITLSIADLIHKVV